MKVIVSACLLGENCKYNGGNNVNEKLINYLKQKEQTEQLEIISVCPEMLGGLPAPRESVEVVQGIPMTRDGQEVSREFSEGISKARKLFQPQEVRYAVLQSRSPTCGVGRVYDGTFSGKLIPGNGMFAQALQKLGILVYDVAEFVKQI